MLIVAFCVHGKDEKIEYLQRTLAAKEERIKQLELMVECRDRIDKAISGHRSYILFPTISRTCEPRRYRGTN